MRGEKAHTHTWVSEFPKKAASLYLTTPITNRLLYPVYAALKDFLQSGDVFASNE